MWKFGAADKEKKKQGPSDPPFQCWGVLASCDHVSPQQTETGSCTPASRECVHRTPQRQGHRRAKNTRRGPSLPMQYPLFWGHRKRHGKGDTSQGKNITWSQNWSALETGRQIPPKSRAEFCSPKLTGTESLDCSPLLTIPTLGVLGQVWHTTFSVLQLLFLGKTGDTPSPEILA